MTADERERMQRVAEWPLDQVESAVERMRDEAAERKDFVSVNAYERVLDRLQHERGELGKTFRDIAAEADHE